MQKIKCFEDLNAWQESRKLVQMVFVLCNKNAREYSLNDQIKRSAISVMGNIAEGFGRYSIKDSKQFYTLARGSIAETQSHLYVFKDQRLISDKEFDVMFEQSVVINKLINGLIRNAVEQINNL